jgi:hypothetical protein
MVQNSEIGLIVLQHSLNFDNSFGCPSCAVNHQDLVGVSAQTKPHNITSSSILLACSPLILQRFKTRLPYALVMRFLLIHVALVDGM